MLRSQGEFIYWEIGKLLAVISPLCSVAGRSLCGVWEIGYSIRTPLSCCVLIKHIVKYQTFFNLMRIERTPIQSLAARGRCLTSQSYHYTKPRRWKARSSARQVFEVLFSLQPLAVILFRSLDLVQWIISFALIKAQLRQMKYSVIGISLRC